MKYFLINRGYTPESRTFSDARNLSIFLLGKQTSNWLIVKSDQDGDRVVPVSSGDISLIEKACLAA